MEMLAPKRELPILPDLFDSALSIEMLAPKRELPIVNAKFIVLKMVLGQRLDGRTLM
jgi:hypothetical protein